MDSKLKKEMNLYDLAQQDYNVLEEMIIGNPKMLDTKDPNDRYLIHWAALSGRDKLMEFLLSRPEPETHFDDADDTNATPLILATLGGHLNIIKLLLAKGVNINHKNWQGHSSLQYASSKGWKEIVAYLLEKGADVNVTDDRNDSALHRAASIGRLEILEMLLKNSVKPNVNIQNKEGNTPLHLACEDEQIPCAMLLIDNGALVEILNKSEQSPLDLCKPGLKRQIKSKLNI